MRYAVSTLAFLVMSAVPASAAFEPPVDSAGSVKASIEGPGSAIETGKAYPIRVVVENTGKNAVKGTIRLAVIDDFHAKPSGPQSFKVAAGGKAVKEFKVTAGPSTYAAHYPIHAFVEFKSDGRDYTVHPILVLEAKPANPPKARLPVKWEPFPVASGAVFAVGQLPTARPVIVVFGEKPRVLESGWEGTDSLTRCYIERGVWRVRGEGRETIVIHPPWFDGKAGTAWVEYPLRLPTDAQWLKLFFANAIRDHAPERGEPPSDGVTFRVRVALFDAPDGALGEVVYEKHSMAKQWERGEADLAKWAGKAIRLQLESHPGPKSDTTCDESYWADVNLNTLGPAPAKAIGPMETGPYKKLGLLRGSGGDFEVRLWPSDWLNSGVPVGGVGFVRGSDVLLFRGFRIRVAGAEIGGRASACSLVSSKEEPDKGIYRTRNRYRCWAGEFDVVCDLRVAGPALKARFRIESAPKPVPWFEVRIEDVATGPWNRKAERIYAGPGNVIVQPGSFDLAYDGHRLSTSFAGYDFPGGISIVHAVDAVPDKLRVDPDSGHYSLHAPGDQEITIIPCPDVWNGVKAWREMNGLKPAGGVKKLAGRFAFDLWGGKYAESAKALERAFKYGLTDSVVVWHNWQRWGYDYRLPEIWPPHQTGGTVEEFAALAETCRKNGVLFALHDNYIDYYPDAEGYSYDKITFNSDGTPVKAWLNSWHLNAQSYRWRADQVREPLERNVNLIKAGCRPTAFFIDVWSSIGPYDYWTRAGAFVNREYTRGTWGDSFAWIRETLGEDAPQISESGHDALIGDLDGAQANHIRAGKSKEWTTWNVESADAERIPWFDAAHHDRFILHGAGYPGRYEGGLDPKEHGIYSDDYIATEVLTGHPAMVSEAFGRDVVRKYWLLHDLMLALAGARIEKVEFVGGDIHRQHVTWDNGGEVWVNRGNTAWKIDGHILPEFGFYARVPSGTGAVEVAIEKKKAGTVEWSFAPDALYANARGSGETSFGTIATDGAVRLVRKDGATLVMPLPDSPATRVVVVRAVLPWTVPEGAEGKAYDEDGRAVGTLVVEDSGGKFAVDCPPGIHTARIGKQPIHPVIMAPI
jgi:hypothetical protein